MSDIEEELKVLAELMHEIAMKHGDIYISACNIEGQGAVCCTWNDGHGYETVFGGDK